MEVWQAIVLGVVQGLTEFLPISSSGHLIIFPWLLGWESQGLMFDAALHLGTLAAVVVYFRTDILRMILAIPVALANPGSLVTGADDDATGRQADARLGLLIVIASVPGIIAGLLFESPIEAFFHTDENSNRAIATIATMLILVGIVLAIAERVAPHTRTIGRMRWMDAVMVGCAQALALIPGTSRSGATITAGLFRGLRRADAARFSFLAGMPLVLGAGVRSLVDVIGEGMIRHEIALFVSGGVSAALVGFVTIWGLLRFLERHGTTVFVVYRILFGFVLFAVLYLR